MGDGPPLHAQEPIPRRDANGPDIEFSSLINLKQWNLHAWKIMSLLFTYTSSDEGMIFAIFFTANPTFYSGY